MITGQTTSIRIYNAIKESLPSEVKEYGLWNNQISKVKDGVINPIRYPAAFVQFENEYNQLSVGRQEVNGRFILYVCLQSLKHSDTEILLFKDYIYQQLTKNLPSKGFSDFYRVFELQDTDYDNLIVWQQEYSYSYIIDDLEDEIGRIPVHPYNINNDVHY